MKKKLLSLALAVLLVFSIIPAASVQAETTTTVSSVCLLKAKAGTNKITYTWKAVTGADHYKLYQSYCAGSNTAYKRIKTTNDTSYTKTNLKTGRAYKAYVVAFDIEGNQIAKSHVAHAQVKGGKYSNASQITATGSFEMTVGTSKTIKAKITKKDGSGTLLYQSHCGKIRYFSKDKTVAKVNSSGKVTAVGAGTTYIFSIAPNGIYAKTKITVYPQVYLDCSAIFWLIYDSYDFDDYSDTVETLIPLTLKETSFDKLASKHTEYSIHLNDYLDMYPDSDKNYTLNLTFSAGKYRRWSDYDNQGYYFDREGTDYLLVYWTVTDEYGETIMTCDDYYGSYCVLERFSEDDWYNNYPIYPSGTIPDKDIWTLWINEPPAE